MDLVVPMTRMQAMATPAKHDEQRVTLPNELRVNHSVNALEGDSIRKYIRLCDCWCCYNELELAAHLAAERRPAPAVCRLDSAPHPSLLPAANLEQTPCLLLPGGGGVWEWGKATDAGERMFSGRESARWVFA